MRRASCWNLGSLAVGAALWALAVAPSAGAQELETLSADPLADLAKIEAEVPETDLDATELRRELRPRDVDRDVADTVLIFTNKGGGDARVHCAGFDKQGGLVGFAWLKVPNLGLRYVTASRISRGVDFVGHVQCAAPARVKGSAVLASADLTDLPVIQVRRQVGRMKFLVVATY
jgi:hypothetical protein